MDNEIINTFYNYVLPGALKGEVDCGIPVRILLNVFFIDSGTRLEAENKYGINNIPTLFISEQLFNEYLVKYITTMLEFYDGVNLHIPDEYLIAYFECMMIVKMGKKDYAYPLQYLSKMTEAIINNPFELSDDYSYSGHINILDSDVYTKVSREKPNQEAPFKFCIEFRNNEETYDLQTIRFYIVNGIVYIGAIQREAHSKVNKKSKINRKLFKANENVNTSEELTNTNPGSVAGMSIFVSFLNLNGYGCIKSMEYQCQREIDKIIHIANLSDYIQNEELPEPKRAKVIDIIEQSNGYFVRKEIIQAQLCNSISRIAVHFTNASAYKNEDDETSLVCENITDCNNPLLKELYLQIQEQQKKLT